MENLIKSTSGRFVARITHDCDPESPRSWDNLFTIYHPRNRHFSLSEGPVPADHSNYLVLPLYAYIHSGIAFSLAPFSCPWDSGQCGLFYVSHADLKREYGTEKITPEIIAMARKVAEGEIEALNQYFSGEIYQYVIVDTTDGQEMDSCGGFFGLSYIESEITDALKFYDKKYSTPGLFPESYSKILKEG